MPIRKYLYILIVSFSSLYIHSSTINKLTYAAWEKADVDLLYVLPSKINSETKILFVIHGASRNAERYLSMWIKEAKDKNVLLIAPRFKKEDHPYYSTLGMATHDGKLIDDKDIWLNDSLERFFTLFKEKYKLSSDQYLVYGFSGGSQFVHRYLMYGNDRGVQKAAIGSAGWYTFIQNSPFPYGIKNMPLEPGRIEWLMSKEVLFLLGDMDNNPNHSSLNKSPGSMKQGFNRYERGINYFDHLIRIGNEFQTPFRWRYSVMRGVDHDMKRMTQPAIEFLLKDLEYKY